MDPLPWTSQRLIELSGGYWSACALHAGVKLGVFTALAGRPCDALELARRLDCDRRGLSMLLVSLAAMGLLEVDGTSYVNTPAAASWLDRNSPQYCGHILLHHHHLMESWAHLDRAVKSGHPQRQGSAHSEEEWQESFLMGMFNLAMGLAPGVVPQIDLGGRRRLLDLGGGPGTWAIHFCREHPDLTAVVFDLPGTRPFAERTIAEFGLEERVVFAAGDFQAEAIPGRYEIAWLSQILHGEGPAGCATILKGAVGALEPGGMILVHEFILDDDRPGPLFPALFSLNMLLATESGQAYTEGEIRQMLSDAGVREIRRLPLKMPGPSAVMVGLV